MKTVNHPWPGDIASVLCAIGLLASFPVGAQPAYQITDLGTLNPDDQYSQALGINNYGQVAGFVRLNSAAPRAFLWTPDAPGGTTGRMIDLGPSTSGQDGAYKLNDYGEVLLNRDDGGYLWIPDNPNGTTGSIGVIGAFISGFNVKGYGINSAGQVTGFGYPGVCYLWTPDNPHGAAGSFNYYFNGTDLEPGFGYSSHAGFAQAVNDSGQVAGAFAPGFYYFPTIHSDPNFHYSEADIVVPGYDPGSQDYSGVANAINSLAHLAGSGVFPGTGRTPFFFDGSAMINFTSGGYGDAFGINALDQVVGSTNPGGAFLYANGTLYRLIDLIGSGTGWSSLSDAFAINDGGQIAGAGVHNGQVRAFLMTPQ